MSSHCQKNPYLIPQLYVKGLKSDEYLVLEENGDRARRSRECGSLGDCFGKTVYGILLDELIDVAGKTVVRDFIVVLPPQFTRGLLLRRGALVEPIPVEGVRVSIEVCEGDRVSRRGTIAYTTTRKLEFRRVRSHTDGVVVYIHYTPYGGVEQDIVFIAREEEVKLVDIV